MAVLRGSACKWFGTEGEGRGRAGCGCPAPAPGPTSHQGRILDRQSFPGSEWQAELETQWHEPPLSSELAVPLFAHRIKVDGRPNRWP